MSSFDQTSMFQHPWTADVESSPLEQQVNQWLDPNLTNSTSIKDDFNNNFMEEETYNVEEAENVAPPSINVDDQFNASPTKAVLHEIADHVRQIASHLEKLKTEQRKVPVPLQREHYNILQQGHSETKSVVDYDEKRLSQLLDSLVEPAEMDYILQLQEQLRLQSKQVELFLNELKYLANNTPTPSAALVIVAQPFPASVKQNKNLEETVSVRLLTGARCDPINLNSLVKGQIVPPSGRGGKTKNPVTVENADRVMVDGLATFNDLKFPVGTRKKSVQMSFDGKVSVKDVDGSTHQLSLSSEATKPFVVKTNENQWHEAEGVLLQQSAFNGMNEISWARFINWLNKYYLMATKQNFQAPVRPLTVYDIEYLHGLSVFNRGATVSQKQFDTFWAWFGPMLHKIRYQRHICNLWTRGFICGFLSRDEVNAVLGNEKVGTFLIRFSERNAGAFVICYVAIEDAKMKVHHYLVQDDDTFAAKKTLPDFLHECRDFTILLQICYDIQQQRRILRRCEKDAVLREYYKPTNSVVTDGTGYRSAINVWN